MKFSFIYLNFFALLFYSDALSQDSTIKAYAGYSFQYPAGWSKSGDDGVYEFTRPGKNISLNIQPHLYANRDEMIADIGPTNDAQSGTYLTATWSAYGSSGLYVKHQGYSNNFPVLVQSINLFSPYGVGITISFTCTPDSNRPSYFDMVKKVAASVQFSSPRPSPYALQWKQKITGRQLLYLYTETGIGGGSYEKRAFDLCSNGNFSMTFDNGYSSSNADNNFSAGGNDAGTGLWEVYSLNGQALLYLRYKNGAVKMKTLTSRNSPTRSILTGQSILYLL